MKEIEVKFKVSDLEQAYGRLSGLGCEFKEIDQEDVIFVPESHFSLPVDAGVNVLRVRRQGGNTEFTLKQSLFGNNLAKIEKEVEISDGGIMEEAIRLLGYKEIARVKKTRKKCRHGEYEFCLDDVEGLGSYMEVEKITDEEPMGVQQRMIDMIRSLGIETGERAEFGYDVMIYRKQRSKS